MIASRPSVADRPEIELISHHLCPYVQRVAIALAEKQIPFKRSYIDLADKPAWFTALSPLGKVPLLRIGETALFESAVICEYLEDAYPRPLHPADPVERARERAWIEVGSAVLGDIWGLETARDAETAKRKAADLRAKFIQIDAVLRPGAGPWFAGRRFGLVDAAFGPIFRYFDLFDRIADFGVFTGLANLRRWRDRLATRPSIRTAVTPDYQQRLSAFLAAHDAYLHHLASGHAIPETMPG